LFIVPIGDGNFGIKITALFLFYYLLAAVITLCLLSVTQVSRLTDLDIFRGPRFFRAQRNHKYFWNNSNFLSFYKKMENKNHMEIYKTPWIFQLFLGSNETNFFGKKPKKITVRCVE